MRPERRKSKIKPRQVLIYAIIIVGTLILLGLFFWIFKPFGGDINKSYGYYRYVVY